MAEDTDYFSRNQQWVKPGSNGFSTDLGQEEPQFRQWVQQNKVLFDLESKFPQDYDMRGFYKALKSGDPRASSAIDPNDSRIHYPDYWKTPYHETFSSESQWATPDAPAWNDKDQLVAKDGTVVFDDRAQKVVADDQPNSIDPFGSEKYESPTLAAWAKQAAGKDVDTLKGLYGGAKYTATEMIPRLFESVQQANENYYGPGPKTMSTDELPFELRDRSPGASAETAMNLVGLGAGGAVKGAAGALGGKLADIWVEDASKLTPGQFVTAGPGGQVGKFKGVSPAGVVQVDWKAKPTGNESFKQAASEASDKFGKDKSTAIQKYWNQVKQPAIKPGSEEATTDLWSKLREPAPVEKEMTIEEAMSAIEKAIKEPWTGESKSMEYPSSNHKVSTSHSEYFNDLGEFPQVVPFRPPEKAVSQGYVTPAVHGTVLGESRWTPSAGGELGGRGDALRLPYQELGVHFGTPDQARHFTGNELRESTAPRTYPVVLQTGKSLELPDMGNWNIDLIKDGLWRLDRGSGYGVDAGYFKVADPQGHLGEFPASEMDKINSIKEMRGYLHSKGYDSINYINKVEGPGQRSYIMFKPSPDEPDFVSGVRSPFAGFDPSKILRPDIAAGVTGIAGAATIAPSESKAKTAPTKGGQDQSSPTLSPGVVKFIMEFLKANPDLAQEMSTRMQDVINGKQIQGQQPPQGPVNGP